MIECEIEEEGAVHIIDSWESDDAFLEYVGARTEYSSRHEKRNHKRYSDIQAYFEESMEDKIEGLGEFLSLCHQKMR